MTKGFSCVCGLSLALLAGAGTAGSDIKTAPAAADTAASQPAAGDDAASAVLKSQTGLASWYGAKFHGKPTASGQPFDSAGPLAAHPDWPFGTRVKVTNLENQRSHQVHIVDRGPGKAQREKGVVIDLSQGVAEKLGFADQGKVEVRLDVLEWGSEDAD